MRTNSAREEAFLDTLVLIPESTIKRVQHVIRKLLAPNTTNDATVAKIDATNSVIRGWCQYYRNTSSPSGTFGNLSHEVIWEMTHWLGRKYKIGAPEVMKRYRKEVNGCMTLGTKSIALVLPNMYKVKRLLTKTWHNPYTTKEAIIREKFIWYESIWSGHEDRLGWSDLREEAILLKGTVCTMNGPECESNGKALHPSEVVVDHIIPRIKFKDPTEADSMDNLQILCTPCNRAKTKTDLKVLSRMRRKSQIRFKRGG